MAMLSCTGWLKFELTVSRTLPSLGPRMANERNRPVGDHSRVLSLRSKLLSRTLSKSSD